MSSQNETNLKKSYDSEHDPESLHVVRGKYQDLQSMIESLNDKLNLVSDFQEKEFLSAYRVHMLSVQLELKELQEKVAKAEMLLQDDGEVSKLEEECNWFRNETNRLQTHSSAMQHDIQTLRTRLTALRDQNQYLSSQLKAVMKRSRVLEVEIDLAKQNIELHQLQEQGTDGSRASTASSSHRHANRDRNHEDYGRDGQQSLNYSSDEEDIISALDREIANEEEQEEQIESGSGRIQGRGQGKGDGDRGGGLGQSMSAIAIGNRPRPQNSNNTLPMRRVQSVGPDLLLLPSKQRFGSPPRSPTNKSSSRPGRGGGGAGGIGKGSLGNNHNNTHIQHEIKSLQKQLDALISSKSNLELEIEEKTRVVFQNVVKRRSLGVARNSKNRYFQSLARQADATGQDSIEQELDTFQFSSKTPIEKNGNPIVGGITELGLEHLTDIDRKEVMINLFSHSEIFEEVVRNLGHNYPIL